MYTSTAIANQYQMLVMMLMYWQSKTVKMRRKLDKGQSV